MSSLTARRDTRQASTKVQTSLAAIGLRMISHSGVQLLLNLETSSPQRYALFSSDTMQGLAQSYQFRAPLGDQDFYRLFYKLHPELFAVLCRVFITVSSVLGSSTPSTPVCLRPITAATSMCWCGTPTVTASFPMNN